MNLIPLGYMTKIAGVLLILTSAGLFADLVGQMIELDMLPQVTTWADVSAKFGEGLGLLGLRRAIENAK